MGAVWTLMKLRPRMIGEVLRSGWAFRARGGILPARDLVRWRTATAYGSAEAAVRVEDLAAFLKWRKTVRSVMR
ncbi:hypothetical protein BH23ACT5_BH23ACT5_11590 [soil metagenome]